MTGAQKKNSAEFLEIIKAIADGFGEQDALSDEQVFEILSSQKGYSPEACNYIIAELHKISDKIAGSLKNDSLRRGVFISENWIFCKITSQKREFCLTFGQK